MKLYFMLGRWVLKEAGAIGVLGKRALVRRGYVQVQRASLGT